MGITSKKYIYIYRYVRSARRIIEFMDNRRLTLTRLLNCLRNLNLKRHTVQIVQLELLLARLVPFIYRIP